MEASRKMKSKNSVLRRNIHDIYQNIACVFAVSFLGFLVVFPGLFLLPVALGIVYGVFTLFPSLAGICYAMSQKLKNKEFRYTLFFKGFKLFYLKSFGLGILFMVLAAIPVFSWWYYLNSGTGLSLFIAILQTFLCLIIFMALTYSIPIMVNEGKSISFCIRASIKLSMDNVLYTIVSFIAITIISALLIIAIITIPLLLGGIISVIMLNLYDNLMQKYSTNEE